MPEATHLEGGALAPAAGAYQEHNVFGTPTGRCVTVRQGEELPSLPIGFTWSLADGPAGQDGLPPMMVDPLGAAERIAMEIIGCEPERRPEALRKAYSVILAIGLAKGFTEADADFAQRMHDHVRDTVLAIEASGGGKGGIA